LAAIVSLLVAYEATNALHFALNWLLLGLAMAVAWDLPGEASAGSAVERTAGPSTIEPEH
jgi:hypothetical protein